MQLSAFYIFSIIPDTSKKFFAQGVGCFIHMSVHYSNSTTSQMLNVIIQSTLKHWVNSTKQYGDKIDCLCSQRRPPLQNNAVSAFKGMWPRIPGIETCLVPLRIVAASCAAAVASCATAEVPSFLSENISNLSRTRMQGLHSKEENAMKRTNGARERKVMTIIKHHKGLNGRGTGSNVITF